MTPIMNAPETWRQVLVQLHALQHWYRLPKAYGSSVLTKPRFEERLRADENRKVTLRLMKHAQCIGCDSAVPETSTGDHIIAKSIGGPDGAGNYVPLCRSCNASKGARDLFAWMQTKGRTVGTLALQVRSDLVCAYARLMYQHLDRKGELDTAPHDAVLRVHNELLSTLP